MQSASASASTHRSTCRRPTRPTRTRFRERCSRPATGCRSESRRSPGGSRTTSCSGSRAPARSSSATRSWTGARASCLPPSRRSKSTRSWSRFARCSNYRSSSCFPLTARRPIERPSSAPCPDAASRGRDPTGLRLLCVPVSLAQAQSDQHSERRRDARERQNGYRNDDRRGPWSACDEEPGGCRFPAARVSRCCASSTADERELDLDRQAVPDRREPSDAGWVEAEARHRRSKPTDDLEPPARQPHLKGELDAPVDVVEPQRSPRDDVRDRPAAEPSQLDRLPSEREPPVRMLVPEWPTRRAQRLVSTRVIRLERSHVSDDTRGDDRPAARLHRPTYDRRPAHHLRRNGKREVLFASPEADDRLGASDHPPTVGQRCFVARGRIVERQRGWRVSVLEGQVRVAAADAEDQQSGEGHGYEAQSAHGPHPLRTNVSRSSSSSFEAHALPSAGAAALFAGAGRFDAAVTGANAARRRLRSG